MAACGAVDDGAATPGYDADGGVAGAPELTGLPDLGAPAADVPAVLPTDTAGDAPRDATSTLPDLEEAPDLLGEDLLAPDLTTTDVALPPPDTGEPSVSEKQAAAMAALVTIRAEVGSTSLAGAEGLHAASQAHAAYFAQHCRAIIEGGLSPHEEEPARDGFSGVYFWDRAQAAGYDMNGGWEVMAFEDDPALAVSLWMETLYHRIPLVHPNARDAGYGGAAVQDDRCRTLGYRGADVMDFGGGAAPDDIVVLYPWEGQDEVPVRWLGNESPQPPPPPGDGYPSGPIVTVTFPWTSDGQLTGGAHDLRGPDGESLAHQFLHPDNDAYLSDTLCLYADDPLLPGATYTATMGGTRNGEAFSYTWSFTTAF